MSNKRNCFLCEPPSASIFKAHIVKCIVYEYDVDGHVKYATCIYKRESRKDMFIKAKFLNIVEQRFKETPKFFNIDNIDVTNCEKLIVNRINDLISEE